MGRILLTGQSIVRFHVRVVGWQKVVATDLCLVCKVLVVKGADQRRRNSELETVTLLHCSVRQKA